MDPGRRQPECLGILEFCGLGRLLNGVIQHDEVALLVVQGQLACYSRLDQPASAVQVGEGRLLELQGDGQRVGRRAEIGVGHDGTAVAAPSDLEEAL